MRKELIITMAVGTFMDARDWDLNENISNNYNQLFTKVNIGFNTKKIGQFNYNFENLNYKNYFNGLRNSLNVISNQNKSLEFWFNHNSSTTLNVTIQIFTISNLYCSLY